MRYEEFRDRLQDALRDAGLVFEHIGQPPEKSTSPAAPGIASFISGPCHRTLSRFTSQQE